MNTTLLLYVDGFFLSNFAAYSSGTGTVIGITSAAATVPADGLLSLMTSVWSSGVVIPEMSGIPSAGLLGAPTMSPKYPVA